MSLSGANIDLRNLSGTAGYKVFIARLKGFLSLRRAFIVKPLVSPQKNQLLGGTL
jgi:hypothetical protein